MTQLPNQHSVNFHYSLCTMKKIAKSTIIHQLLVTIRMISFENFNRQCKVLKEVEVT